MLYAPRRYDDGGALQAISDVTAGARAYVRGTVKRASVRRFFRRASLEVELQQADAVLLLRWFHHRGPVPARFAVGADVFATGLVRQGKRSLEMVQPTADVGVTEGSSLRPRYPRIPGVSSRALEKLCALAVSAEHDEPLGVPPDLPSLSSAAHRLHALPPQAEGGDRASLLQGASPAHRRLAWENLLLLRLSALRRDEAAVTASPIGVDVKRVLDPWLGTLPFSPTQAQRAAIAEIAHDLSLAEPMRRLLTGDVGSGKTLVAAAAIELCAAAGRRAAFLAPTTILAEQQAEQLRRALLPTGRRVVLLHAGVRKAERTRIVATLADPHGAVDVVVGTHALLDDALQIARLALVVIDEQQRFGVAARGKLLVPARGLTPHLLSLSATPIPRTLALALRGALAVGHLHEKPPGRSPVVTSLATEAGATQAALTAVRDEVAAGGKVYWICPQIDDDETGALRGVLEVEPWLREALGPEISVACCHGRQAPSVRVSALRAFREGAHVLVATSVVEVGLDVPEATLIVIEGAQRFGLAQLHQLRGRVGRGARAGRCVLLAPNLPALETQRLGHLLREQDGLAIAEADLALRGMGELAGHAQSGLPSLPPLAADEMERLMEAADRAAQEILALDPALTAAGHRRLRLRLGVGADLLAHGLVVDAGA